MLKMPEEFGTADEMLAGLPKQLARIEEYQSGVLQLQVGTEEFRVEGMRLVTMQLSAQLDWALAAINELQTEVKMLRGDGR